LDYIVLGAGVVDLEWFGEDAGCDAEFLAVLGVCGVGGEGGLANGLSSDVGVGCCSQGLTRAGRGCLGREEYNNGSDGGHHGEGVPDAPSLASEQPGT
jgi:hypothetical protein